MTTQDMKSKLRETHRRRQQRIAGTPPTTTAHVGTVPEGAGTHPLGNLVADNPHTDEYERTVPVRLGVYVVDDPPNDRTVNYERRFEPTGNRHPAIVEKYTITCQDSVPDWRVTHAVKTREKRRPQTISEKVRNVRTLATGFDSFEDALEFAKRCAEVRSTSDTLPDECDDALVEECRELRLNDDSKPA